MSRKRKEILRGAGVWDAFYDKRVQSILERRRSVPALSQSPSKEVRLEFLAWPIIAFCAADELAQDLKVRRHIDFLEAYGEDRQFLAELLVAATRYHSLCESEKSLSRRIADLSNVCFVEGLPWEVDWAGLPLNGGGLYDWKTIADQIGTRNSVSQMKTEFHREKKRRDSIRSAWSEHFDAWNDLQELRQSENRLFCRFAR